MHAFVDGQLPDARRREVVAYLDAHPDVAEQVAAYLDQRDALALLGRHLAEVPASARLAGPEAALLDAMRQRRRINWRTFAAVAALAAVVGWGGWTISGRPPSTTTPA